MIQNLPVELRHEILSYIVPNGRNQTTTLYLSERCHHQRNKFRYGIPKIQSDKFVYVFCVSQQFLQDAVQIYYATRTFHLEHGLRHQRDDHYPANGIKGDALRTDSLSLFPAYAMQSIKRLHILIREDVRDATSHRRVRNALERFVAKLAGRKHALLELRVHLCNVERFWDRFLKLPSASCYKHRFEAALTEAECLRFGFVLEPLAGLRGVGSVTICGINPGFDRKLERVMSCSKDVVLARGVRSETHALQSGVRKAAHSTKGRRVAKCSPRPIRRFYEPVYNWNLEIRLSEAL